MPEKAVDTEGDSKAEKTSHNSRRKDDSSKRSLASNCIIRYQSTKKKSHFRTEDYACDGEEVDAETLLGVGSIREEIAECEGCETECERVGKCSGGIEDGVKLRGLEDEVPIGDTGPEGRLDSGLEDHNSISVEESQNRPHCI